MNTNPKSSSGERVRLACWLRCPRRNELCKAYGSPLLLEWAYALCNFQQRYYLTYFKKYCNTIHYESNSENRHCVIHRKRTGGDPALAAKRFRNRRGNTRRGLQAERPH